MTPPHAPDTDASLCWVISDGRKGIENQALGLAETAARINPLAIQSRVIDNKPAFKAASPRLQFALKPNVTDYGLSHPLPEFAIGCGRQAIAPLLALKKANPHIFTAYVQDPRVDASFFDVVFVPQHDKLRGANVETMIGSPNRVTRDLIITQTLQFAVPLSKLPMPRVAMLIGGNSKTHKLSKLNHADHIRAAKQAIDKGYSLMITPSRRTPNWAIEDYKRLASDYDNVWLYDGTGNGENPYYAFLGGAETILVTEESANMLTEACAVGKAVFRLPMSGDPKKFAQLYDALETQCGVTRFEGQFTGEDYPPLDETHKAAEKFWAHAERRLAILN